MAPKFGISLSFQTNPGLGETWDTSYRESIELASEADRLGFDSIWASEHHGEADGYCPSPVVACAALAVAAPNCRIGQGVALAPLYGHPLRLAEDLSVVDNISGGRIEIGLGQGYRPAEFESFGWNYKTRTRAFEESLDILGLAWRGERFDYEGRSLQRERRPAAAAADHARAAAALGRRRRAESARPRRALSRRADRGAADRAAASVAADQIVRRRGRAAERRTAAACADARGPCRRFGGRRDQAAQALHRPRLSRAVRARAHRPDLRRSRHRRAQAAHRRQSDLSLGSFMQDRWFLGTPAEIAAKMIEWLPRFSLKHFIFQGRQPGMTLRHAVDSLEALAKDVLPVVRARR